MNKLTIIPICTVFLIAMALIALGGMIHNAGVWMADWALGDKL